MCIRDRLLSIQDLRVAFRMGKGVRAEAVKGVGFDIPENTTCLLYTSDAADERSSVDLGGRRIIKKQNIIEDSTRNKR